MGPKAMTTSRVDRTDSTPLLTRSLRALRPLHRWLGIPLALFILLSSITGLILGWKKEVDLLQPPSSRGVSNDLSTWIPVQQIEQIARQALATHLTTADPEEFAVDRLDLRPDKGIAKVRFVLGDWEVQVDGTSGEVYSVARRHADWIERVHDGSFISEGFKLIAMNGLGLGLIALTFSGIWLWAGPILLRRQRRVSSTGSLQLRHRGHRQ